MGCDQQGRSSPTSTWCFNPRTHMGCDSILDNLPFAFVCFNPRTHMGCDSERWLQDAILRVSIHAPTWGATCCWCYFERSWQVSIHAPTWGATILIHKTCKIRFGFNPRTHMGCDLPLVLFRKVVASFNPRTHMGCDPFFHLMLWLLICFNPRTHMGCDFKGLCYLIEFESFNPRTHMGCDYIAWLSSASCQTFQSTHPHGVRQYGPP